MEKAHFGTIGLGTMGRNFLLNVAEQGITSVGYDLDAAKRQLLLDESKGIPVSVGQDLSDFLNKLESPRNIMLLVPAGPIVDTVIGQLVPHLDSDDLIIDGGNSHFTDTERREAELSARGIGFMGIGVSGGEEGARHGASIMPGGKRAFYQRIEPVLRAVAAKVNSEPCVAYMGSGSAGHFVKMVHNGIEYGLMQILAETYDYMLRVLRMDYRQMSDAFAEWNDSELNSFLVEITAEVLRKVDADTGKPLVEMVLDKAAQKGTGKWTSQAAMDLGVPIPTIDSAVSMRQISSQKETRILLAKRFRSDAVSTDAQMRSYEETVDSERQHDQKAARAEREVETIASKQIEQAVDRPVTEHISSSEGEPAETRVRDLDELKKALLSSFIITYAQGLSLLQSASLERQYDLDLAEIARIWRGGCIIRSALLDQMSRAYAERPDLPNLILDDHFASILQASVGDWRKVIEEFSTAQIPALCVTSTLSYFDAYRSERLPANLIQAQRDFFGAHTYQRTDKEGVFHTLDWKE